MREAGAVYEDKEVVVDGNLVTSRQPADLPAFLRETMKKLRRQG
jgi:protease I